MLKIFLRLKVFNELTWSHRELAYKFWNSIWNVHYHHVLFHLELQTHVIHSNTMLYPWNFYHQLKWDLDYIGWWQWWFPHCFVEVEQPYWFTDLQLLYGIVRRVTSIFVEVRRPYWIVELKTLFVKCTAMLYCGGVNFHLSLWMWNDNIVEWDTQNTKCLLKRLFVFSNTYI